MIVPEGEKWCPGCQQSIDLDKAYWPTRRVKRADGTYREGPAGYCRTCKNKRETRRQKDRRHGVPPLRTNCDVCGQLKAGIQYFASDSLDRAHPFEMFEEDVILDPNCLEHLQRCDWDIETADSILDIFAEHLEDEERRATSWRANRRRPAHLGINDPPAFNHYICEDEAFAWAGVVIFLQRQAKMKAAREISPWKRAAIGSVR